MNLNALAGPAVSAVNPAVKAMYQQSTGTNTAPSGHRTPSYATARPIMAQLQALTYKDLVQIDGLNLNGQAHGMYVSGDIQGIVRQDDKGGDLVTLPDKTVWLVVHVLENWFSTGGWAKVAVVRQSP